MTHEHRLVIIAVIYNSHPETLQFAESIGNCFDRVAQLILVDNSPDQPDATFTEKIRTYDFITYLRAGSNAGYFHGAEIGLQHYLENGNGYPEWIIVSNVDIIFQTPDFLKKLDAIDAGHDIGVIAPAIISKTWKTDLNPYLVSRIPLKKLQFLQAMYANPVIHNGYVLLYYLKKFLRMTFRRGYSGAPGKTNQSQIIYAPHGSCIIFNHNYFERGGTLNHISFLFGEEIFVAETARQINMKVVYHPELQVCHDEHTSIGNFISGRINAFYRQSLKDILHQYYPGADQPASK